MLCSLLLLQLIFLHRVLTLGLQSSECSTWAAVLQSEHILCHLLWIAENSLNLQLIEKVLNTLPFIENFLKA